MTFTCVQTFAEWRWLWLLCQVKRSVALKKKKTSKVFLVFSAIYKHLQCGWKCYKNYSLALLIHTALWFSLKANTKHCLQKIIVHITYLGRSLYTPGHPEQLLHSHPTIESPQISPQSSSASSGGSLPGSIYSPAVLFCSRLPTNRFLSAERSSNNKAWSYVGISGFNIIIPRASMWIQWCRDYYRPRDVKFKWSGVNS